MNIYLQKKLHMSSKATIETPRETTELLGHAGKLLQHTKDGKSEDQKTTFKLKVSRV